MMNDSAWSLRANLWRLWADHVIRTRQYIVAVAGTLPDIDAAAGRLLKNQEHIGSAFIPFYGQAAGARLTELLKKHILIAVDLLAAAKAGDDAKFQAADQRWSANADAIAGFLSSANRFWPQKDVSDQLHLHPTLTKGEAVARLTGKWDDESSGMTM
jgi:hypothetical protein